MFEDQWSFKSCVIFEKGSIFRGKKCCYFYCKITFSSDLLIIIQISFSSKITLREIKIFVSFSDKITFSRDLLIIIQVSFSSKITFVERSFHQNFSFILMILPPTWIKKLFFFCQSKWQKTCETILSNFLCRNSSFFFFFVLSF